MAITLYDLTVPVFLRGLGVMSAVLEKGRAYAEAAGIDPVELVEARLAPDMLTLAGQVQRASDTAKFTAVRIGGVENVRFADEEKSFADLYYRIDWRGRGTFLRPCLGTRLTTRKGLRSKPTLAGLRSASVRWSMPRSSP